MSGNHAKCARLPSATQSMTFPIFIFSSHTELTDFSESWVFLIFGKHADYCYVCTLWKMQLNELRDSTEPDIAPWVVFHHFQKLKCRQLRDSTTDIRSRR
jgi:hypothetical protein